jgi:hypothetical protein
MYVLLVFTNHFSTNNGGFFLRIILRGCTLHLKSFNEKVNTGLLEKGGIKGELIQVIEYVLFGFPMLFTITERLTESFLDQGRE